MHLIKLPRDEIIKINVRVVDVVTVSVVVKYIRPRQQDSGRNALKE